MDHLDLGSAPSDEDCAQLGVDEQYEARAKRECRALINQLKRLCGDPPPNARFRIMANPHDFGTYYSVVIDFDPNDEDAVAYAYRCDEESPDQWDLAARFELDAARKGEHEAASPARKAG
jgi:hypothetical protein